MKDMEGNILVAVAEALPARRSTLRRPLSRFVMIDAEI